MELEKYAGRNGKGNFEFMSYEEVKHLAEYSHVWFYSRQKDARQAKITSIKTWKRRPDIEVHLKYGMYEYDYVTYTPTNNPEFLLKEV